MVCCNVIVAIVQIAEDHCWLSLDGTGERESAAEVAAERPQLQGEAPEATNWRSWLYNAGHATVCTSAQAVAAVLASMDTCVGEKSSHDCDEARDLQHDLLACLPRETMYPAAEYLAAELEQDAALDQVKAARAQGSEPMQAALSQMHAPFARLLQCLQDGAESGPGVYGP